MKKSLKECLNPQLNSFSIKVYGDCGYRNFSPEILLDELRPTGKWIHDGSGWKYRFICSECGHKIYEEQQPYCSNCGAKMGR